MNDWLRTSQFEHLSDNETHIWLYQLNLTDPSIKRFYPLLSGDEQTRSEQLIHFIHRKRFIVAHGFLRSVLALYMNQPPNEIRFEKGSNGKPFIENHTLHFNLTHSQDLALVAVNKQNDVGIDVECLERNNEWQKIIKRFFTEPEQQSLFDLPEADQRRAFFQVWTRKEAHMKVTGMGLHLSPTRFTVSVPPSPAMVLRNDTGQHDSRWNMQDIQLPDSVRNYCACVSVENAIGKLVKFIFQ